jgi:hypothetical protein
LARFGQDGENFSIDHNATASCDVAVTVAGEFVTIAFTQIEMLFADKAGEVLGQRRNAVNIYKNKTENIRNYGSSYG